ncbi:MAG: cytochrome c peroxidase [Candidatus Kapaibacterium sp.]
MLKIRLIYCLPLLLFFFSCTDEKLIEPDVETKRYRFLDSIPRELPKVEYPEDNLPNKDRIRLGKLLFEDKRLSRTNEISCSSCHKSEFAFADNTPTTKGVDGLDGTRNSISLMNIAFQKRFLREGGVPSLEMQVLVPFQEHNEFDLNIVAAAQKLSNDSLYQYLSQVAYGRVLDSYVITRSISSFERTLIGGNSKFDKYMNKKATLTTEEERGMVLFFSDSLACASCHSGILFTSQEFANNGLYEEYNDNGRQRLTGLDADNGVFKIPSLRNVALTAPYMHDGSIATLDVVLEHYASAGKPHRNKSKLINGFALTNSDKKAIIAFLNTLTEE